MDPATSSKVKRTGTQRTVCCPCTGTEVRAIAKLKGIEVQNYAFNCTPHLLTPEPFGHSFPDAEDPLDLVHYYRSPNLVHAENEVERVEAPSWLT